MLTKIALFLRSHLIHRHRNDNEKKLCVPKPPAPRLYQPDLPWQA